MSFDLFSRGNKRRKEGYTPSRADLKDNLKIYEIFRDYVKHEDDLVNRRLTWILTIHGFLHAIYGLTLQKKLEIANNISQYLSQHSNISLKQYMGNDPLCNTNLELELFLIFIALTGLSISVSGLYSIIAANNSSNGVGEIFKEIFKLRYSTIYIAKMTDKTTQSYIVCNIDSIINGEIIKVPHITGGGSEENSRYGFYV